MTRNPIDGTIPRGCGGVCTFVAAVFLLVHLSGGMARAQFDLSAIKEHVVVVRAFDQAETALGEISGLIVGNGLVVTNSQMLRGADSLVVVVPGEAQEFAAEVRSLDERSGIAILEAELLTGTGAVFALDELSEDPEDGDVVYVPRFATDGSIEDTPTRGLIAELRRLEPNLQGERAVLFYRHNATLSAREYGMPMLNDCGEVIGLIRPDPDMSLRDLNDRLAPAESTFGVAGAEVGHSLADIGAQPNLANTSCPDADDTIAQQVVRAGQLEEEAQRAQAAADAARHEAEEARTQASEAEQRAAALAVDAAASVAERDAARQAAARLQAAAEEKEAELDDLERRAEAAHTQAQEAEERVARLEQERRLFVGALIAATVVLVAGGLVASRLLRRRRLLLVESEAARRETDDKLAASVTPASFSCLLEGADDRGRNVVIKIDAAQLGSPNGVIVGRNPAHAGIVLDHAEASREHFRLTAHGNDLFIEDLDSTNGTFVNRAVIATGQRFRLSPGDEVGVGGALRVKLSISRDKT